MGVCCLPAWRGGGRPEPLAGGLRLYSPAGRWACPVAAGQGRWGGGGCWLAGRWPEGGTAGGPGKREGAGGRVRTGGCDAGATPARGPRAALAASGVGGSTRLNENRLAMKGHIATSSGICHRSVLCCYGKRERPKPLLSTVGTVPAGTPRTVRPSPPPTGPPPPAWPPRRQHQTPHLRRRHRHHSGDGAPPLCILFPRPPGAPPAAATKATSLAAADSANAATATRPPHHRRPPSLASPPRRGGAHTRTRRRSPLPPRCAA